MTGRDATVFRRANTGLSIVLQATRAKSPQANGICERFHRTVQEEFYSVAFRKKLYGSLEELQLDLAGVDAGKYCFGKTPLETSGIPRTSRRPR